MRLPVGPHLSFTVLRSLFGVVERQFITSCALEEANAVLSVEVLCEVMAKRYIPRVEGSEDDSGASVLVELVAEAVGVMQKMRSAPSDSLCCVVLCCVVVYTPIIVLSNLYGIWYLLCVVPGLPLWRAMPQLSPSLS
jgi:hypothetical protein